MLEGGKKLKEKYPSIGVSPLFVMMWPTVAELITNI
jgi:hypothetical protein